MIHLVTRDNRHLYQQQLAEHHRIRYRYYIEERKWDGLQVRDGAEYDQFDDDATIYCLAIEDEHVIGGTRMYPTIKNSCLAQVCPQLANVKGIPTGPEIYEWTRLFAVKERREGRYGGSVIGKIFAGSVQIAHEEDIKTLSVQFEAWWLPRLHQHGWNIKPLGLPGLIKDEWWIAATIPIDADMVRTVRAYYDVEGDIVIRRGLPKRTLRQVA